MPGELDEISRVIGGLETATTSLKDTFSQHCKDDDRRHEENINALRENNRQIADLNRTLAPLAKTVEAMAPILANYQVSRWKRTGAIGLALTLVGFSGWLVQLVVTGLISYLHK